MIDFKATAKALRKQADQFEAEGREATARLIRRNAEKLEAKV